jgi:hypothetical protein
MSSWVKSAGDQRDLAFRSPDNSPVEWKVKSRLLILRKVGRDLISRCSYRKRLQTAMKTFKADPGKSQRD